MSTYLQSNLTYKSLLHPRRAHCGLGRATLAHHLEARGLNRPLFARDTSGPIRNRYLQIAYFETHAIHALSERFSALCNETITASLDRQLTAANKRAIQQIYSAAFTPDEGYSEAQLELLQHQPELTLLMVRNSKNLPIGYCTGYINVLGKEVSYFIEVVALTPGYQGKGLGKTLLSGFLDIIERNGHKSANLLCDDPNASDNKVSRFYQKLGFVQVGGFLDVAVMKRDLHPEACSQNSNPAPPLLYFPLCKKPS